MRKHEAGDSNSEKGYNNIRDYPVDRYDGLGNDNMFQHSMDV